MTNCRVRYTIQLKEGADLRRKEREIRDIEKIFEIIERCDTCRIAINDGGYPYILPLSFGAELVDGELSVYFHCAGRGKKLELLSKDNRVGFEFDIAHGIVTDESGDNCTVKYESVIGRGKIEILPEDEKAHALDLLMKHYHKEAKGDFIFPEDAPCVRAVTMLRLRAEALRGKSNLRA